MKIPILNKVYYSVYDHGNVQYMTPYMIWAAMRTYRWIYLYMKFDT